MSEILLFREDEDKDYYLMLLKRYTAKFKCSIYAYCLMDNHLHIHLDPRGFDISRLMHSVNTAFVRYYNLKYQRHGPLFQGRFQSRILDSDRYNLAVSAYIHNNPKDIPGYEGREENYPYSSYGIYLEKRRDKYHIIDKSFIAGLLYANNDSFVEKYLTLVNRQRNVDSIEDIKDKLVSQIENDYFSGRNIILRDLPSSRVISFISDRLNISALHSIAVKGSRKLIDYRAFCAYALRVLGGMSYKEICRDMHSITISCCSRLCDRGYELLNGDDNVYAVLFNELASHAA
jgi:REP element-mobilizing transposase RayT